MVLQLSAQCRPAGSAGLPALGSRTSQWIPPSLEIADQAAQLRGELNLRPPDSLQAATALLSRATALITNHPAFQKVKGLEILLLDQLLR